MPTDRNDPTEDRNEAEVQVMICHYCHIGADTMCVYCGHDVRGCTRCYKLPSLVAPLAPLTRDSEGKWQRVGLVEPLSEGFIWDRRFGKKAAKLALKTSSK